MMIELLSTVLLLWSAWGQSESTSNSSNGEILAAVCREGDVLANGEGCATCPAMTSFAGEEGPFTLERVYEGSFSGAGLDEFLAAFSGCEPRFLNSGGTVLLGPEPMSDGSSVITQSAYFPGSTLVDCTIARLADLGEADQLFCELGFLGQGIFQTQVVNHNFTNGELSQYTMARAVDHSGVGCRDSGVIESSYEVSYPDPLTVDVELTRQEVAYPNPSCERVALSEAETLSYSWLYDGLSWVVTPLYLDLELSVDGALTLEQYQEAERQIQAGEIDDTLAAYLAGRINAEQFAALF
ncbi:MAG: hypothetical protein U5L04_05245 [Trueperaceae bacterium]|nr:hypothetical protein [Trueperaceae bacterium]